MSNKRRRLWIGSLFLVALYSEMALGIVALMAILFSLPDALRLSYTAGGQWGAAFILLVVPFMRRVVSEKLEFVRAKAFTDVGQVAVASRGPESARSTKWVRGVAGLVVVCASVETGLAFRDVGTTAIEGLALGFGAIVAFAFVSALPLLMSRSVQRWVSELG